MSFATVKMAHHVNLENIEKYLKTWLYPDEYAGLFYYAIDVCFIPLKAIDILLQKQILQLFVCLKPSLSLKPF